MVDNKKIYQKKHFFRWISIGGILFLLIFQFYSLYSTYQSLSKIINRSIDEAFVKSVKEHRNYRLTSIKNDSDKFSIKYKGSEKKSTPDSDFDKVLDFGELNIDDALYKVNSIAIAESPLEINKLDSIYSEILNKEELSLRYDIVVYKKDSIVLKTKHLSSIKKLESTSIKELDSKYNAQVFYKSPVTQIIQKMLWFFVLSVLLILIVSYALIYQLKMITRQKKIETIRQDFVDSMTHELKHPLQGALSLAEVLENHSFAENPELRNNAIKKIKNNLNSLGKLIDSIVEKSYSDKSEYTAELTKGDIVNDIDEIIANYTISSEKVINFTTNYHNLKSFYLYDKTHFPNAVKNLVDNAIKYSKNPVNINIKMWQESEQLIISVEDNGIGIRQEDLSNVFNKFYRVYSPQKNKGLGLGLSYVKWVCEIHNGEVLVKSTFGKGSTFSIVIPIIEKTEEDEKNSNC